MKRTEISIDEMKAILVDELQFLHEYCIQNDITYYLMYGTLLGAVRHKGFIPWDDDIDIAMPRKDYERFLKTFEDKNKKYKVISINSKGYYLPFAKLLDTSTVLIENIKKAVPIGIYIDIFPIDNMGNDILKADKIIRNISTFRDILSAKLHPIHKKRTFIRNLISSLAFCLPISLNKLIFKIDTIARTFESEDESKYVSVSVFNIYKGKELFHSEWFKNKILLPFEGHEFFAPSEYDSLLKFTYSDYMKLPPEEQRISHHNFKAYRITD